MATLKLRYERKGAHVHVDVFAGPEDGNLGHCGRLVMRETEWLAFVATLTSQPGAADLHFEHQEDGR